VVTHRFVTIGYIRKSFGVQGEVVARLHDGVVADDLVGIEVWTVPPSLGWRRGIVASVEPHGADWKMSFSGLESVEDAKQLSGRMLIVAATDVAFEIVEDDKTGRYAGYRVVDERYGDIGTILETIETGANEVWVVDGRYGQVLVPVIDEVVVDVDEDNSVISTRILDGLIEQEPF
jgi:16S rRNA processing protein RimM